MLQRFYVANNVKYLRNKEVFQKALRNRVELGEERKGFALYIGNLLAAKKSLVYVDETTFISGQCKAKSWQLPNKPNLSAFGDQRLSQTVFGAISPLLKKPVCYFGKSTNQHDFQQFLRRIKQQLPFSHQKPILIYDGASAHTARQSK